MAAVGAVLLCPCAASAATLTVTNTNDSGSGSVRAAVLTANATSGDTIRFAVTGTITLTSGEIPISSDLTIDGPGAGQLAISGNDNSRVFFVDPGSAGATSAPKSGLTVSISGLRIADGNATGGAGGTGQACFAGGGGAAGMGGGLFVNGGAVTLTGVTFSGDTASGGAGGAGGGDGVCGTYSGGGGGVGGPGGDPTPGTGGDLGGNASGAEGAGGTGGENDSSVPGQPGGFGGGGGGGDDPALGASDPGEGGFGGGGGGTTDDNNSRAGAVGGRFAGAGGSGYESTGGGGGAGLGGAVFIRSGALALAGGDSFSADTATGGSGGSPNGGSGEGKGGAVFDDSGASVCERATYTGNRASSAAGTAADNNNTYGIECLSPTSLIAPKIAGTAKDGAKLTCQTGSWTGNPRTFSYAWSLDGTPIAGAGGARFTVRQIDEGGTLTCTVTATNRAGSTSATSKPVKVQSPKVKNCPAVSGTVTGTGIGALRLGMTPAQARAVYSRSSTRGNANEEFFCLTPIGIRVGFGSTKLLAALPAAQRARDRGRVVWISTASPHYAIAGIRAGATVTAAGRKLKLSKEFVVGRNDWYLASDRKLTAVFKARKGIIQEIGIAQPSLVGHRRTAQRTFLTSFS
jgi:hypothetical protein